MAKMNDDLTAATAAALLERIQAAAEGELTAGRLRELAEAFAFVADNDVKKHKEKDRA